MKGSKKSYLKDFLRDNRTHVIALLIFSKSSKYLGEHWHRGLPIEVIPMASTPVKAEIEKRFGGEANLRMGVSKMVG